MTGFNGATNAALKKETVGGILLSFARGDAISVIRSNPLSEVNNVKAIHYQSVQCINVYITSRGDNAGLDLYE